MRLTSEEILELTNQLVSTLKRKRFSVKTNRYGNILYVEKFGIRCCPAILNSLEDGRHGYAYIQLVTNPYSEKDLGSYYKPRTNKSTHVVFDKNDSVDKYAGKDVHIDMHNGKQVIETFANDLNKDYRRITMKREDLDLNVEGDTGFCRYNKNSDSWYISTDNYSLKGELIDLFDLSPESEDMEKAWLICREYYGDDKECPVIRLHTAYDPGIFQIRATIYEGELGPKVIKIIKDWMKNHPSQIVEALVKIKDTGTVFDGMTGVVEEDGGDKLTVIVDFNDEHKVRNRFKKEQIEILED